MKVLPVNKQIEILKHLVNGSGIRPTSRCVGVRETAVSMLVRFGTGCQRFMHREMQDLELTHLQIDEMWTFCRKKQKNITGEEPDLGNIGDQYLFVALDQPTRLIPAYRIGHRTSATTYAFVTDLYERLSAPRPHASDDHDFKKGGYKPLVRISTDAFEPYAHIIPEVFGDYAEYGQIKKDFSTEGKAPKKRTIRSKDHNPIPDELISTSLVERKQSDRSYLYEKVESANDWVFQKIGESAGGNCNVHGALQLLSCPSDA